MAEPQPLDPRSRELLDAFRRRTETQLEPSRVEPVWRKARAQASASSRLRAVAALAAALTVVVAGALLAARTEKALGVVAESGASWQRRGNTVVLSHGKLRVGAPGDVVVVSTPHLQATLSDARALVEVSNGATLVSVESGDVVYRAAGGGGRLQAGASVTVEEAAKGEAPAAAEAVVAEPTAASRLAEETSLYGVAQQARSRGALDESIAALRLYQQKFTDGVFAPEVSMALMADLKARGDVAAAVAEADRFLKKFPAEPHAPGVRAWRNTLEGSR